MRYLIIILLLVIESCGRSPLSSFDRSSNVPGESVKVYTPSLIVSGGDSSISLMWDTSVNPLIKGYNIYRSLYKYKDFTLIEKALTDNKYIDTDIEEGVIYYYKVSETINVEDGSYIKEGETSNVDGGVSGMLFYELFERTDTLDNWATLNVPAEGDIEIDSDGTLHITDTGTNTTIKVYKTNISSFSKFTVKWKEKVTDNHYGGLYIEDDDTGNKTYVVTVAIGVASDWTKTTDLVRCGANDSGTNDLSFQTAVDQNQWHTYKIVGDGSSVTFYIDDVQVGSSLTYSTTGITRLYLWSGSVKTGEVWFDDILLKKE